MPCVNLTRAALCGAIGIDFTREEFEQLCFDFGIELDDVLTDEAGAVVWKVEIPANRYDLLCLEGLARAIRVFLGKEETPVSALATNSQHL